VSHELRTPLTAIRGWGETAKMSVGADEELVSRGLDVILSEADRLSGLVEDLLDFSRMQSGRMLVNSVSATDVSQLLCAVSDMYTELAIKQGIELSYTPPVQSSIVMCDADRLKQVFINIIDNAVKYTEKGGLVLVTETREEGCVRIVVKDTGVGIPAADIDRVKEKFFKSNKTVRGSGIGLAVADEIIKQHQGLLFLESTEGVGTAVTIVLPLYEEPESKEMTEGEEIVLPPEPQDEIKETEKEVENG
jgi:signal transduction histidine kinase